MTGSSLSIGGAQCSLHDALLQSRNLPFNERTASVSQWMHQRACRDSFYLRQVNSPADRQVSLFDPHTGEQRPLLMFGSNNALGLGNHPHVRRRVREAIDHFGVGGPALLNGYTRLHRELEDRLAAFKNKEAAMVFSGGYGVHDRMMSALMGEHDVMIHDAMSRGRFHEAMKQADGTALTFPHDDMDEFARLLEAASETTAGDVFVGIEGVYARDGDLAPLDRIAPLCRAHGAILIVDDAHGIGVMGPGGCGTDAHFGVEDEVDLVLGTFSKAFGGDGGFLAASQAVVDYLRFFARSDVFSASMPPPVAASVLGALEVLEQEPEHRLRLHSNVRYLGRGLRRSGFSVHPQSAILPLPLPETMNLREAASHFHRRGIFLNAMEDPAAAEQRFQINVMASHTHRDLDVLLEAIEEVWSL